MLKQYLLSPCCLKCGSLFLNESLFCQVCFSAEIENNILRPQCSHISQLRHKYLLRWNKGENNVLSEMVYRLKSNNSVAAWAFYAKLLYNFLDLNFKTYKALIPIPGSSKNSVHALLFARQLSILTGLPVVDILSKKTESFEQKTLTAEQRKNKVFIELRQPIFFEQFTKYIFVDDILTTGESFNQCNKAINDNSDNIIISLFYRPKD